MPELYREMDVLVLPSRTTATWAEQFGKVLCEALLCGVPVVGSVVGRDPVGDRDLAGRSGLPGG